MCHLSTRDATCRPLVKSAYQKNYFLIFKGNIFCGYSKEPSRCDGSFERPKHMLKIIGKKIFAIFAEKFCLSNPLLHGHINIFWWSDVMHQ